MILPLKVKLFFCKPQPGIYTRLRVPQQIQWKDITLPERWQLEAIAPTPNIENTEPDFIAQNTDGIVIISFNNNDRHTDSLIRPSSSIGRKTRMMFTLEAPFPLGHLSLIPDLYLPRIFLQLYTFPL